MGIPRERIAIVENGFVIEFDKQGMRIGDRVPGGYLFVDGSGVGDIGKTVIKDREVLARDGFIMVIATVDRKSGELVEDPEIISRGFVYLKEASELMSIVKETIENSLASSNGQNGRRRERLTENISRILYSETKRRPMVFSVINER
jgi:ribonuclease J